MIKISQFDWLAQKSHILSGALAVFAPLALSGEKAMWIGAGVITVWAIVKEAWWDEVKESPEERGSGLRDAFFYFAGTAVALSLWGIKTHGLSL